MKKLGKFLLSLLGMAIIAGITAVCMLTFVMPTKYVKMDKNIEGRLEINPKYRLNMDISHLSNENIFMINKIFEEYDNNLDDQKDVIHLAPNFDMTVKDYNKINSYLILWCNDTDSSNKMISMVMKKNKIKAIKVDLKAIGKYDFGRKRIENKIKEITNPLQNLSVQEKIKGVVKWHDENIRYAADESSTDSLMTNRIGNCNASSLYFRTALEQLGIKCDICINSDPKINHAWNKVTYSNGHERYFDLVNFQPNHDSKYFNSKKTPFKIDSINNYKYAM